MLKKSLVINDELGHQEGMANAYGNLGLVYQTRSELNRAEEMFKKALAIEEKLGLQLGMATDYSNLGLIYQMRGGLDRAEEMLKKALAILDSLLKGGLPQVLEIGTEPSQLTKFLLVLRWQLLAKCRLYL